jgi:hypothetical protein
MMNLTAGQIAKDNFLDFGGCVGIALAVFAKTVPHESRLPGSGTVKL